MTLAGLRPGEKLFEEKLMAEEGLKKTKNKLIHINRVLVPLKQIMNSEDSVLQWYRNLRHFQRHFLMNLIY